MLNSIIGACVNKRLAVIVITLFLVSTAVGSETQRPFAIVIVCGMVTTLFVALVFIPLLYRLLAGKNGIVERPSDNGIDPSLGRLVRQEDVQIGKSVE